NLILLQTFETKTKSTTAYGSFGYLYEVLVTACLSRRTSPRVDLETKYNYLAEFAYHLFGQRRRSLPEHAVRDWHDEYCRAYKLRLDFPELWNELVASGAMDQQNGDYQFRYKYLYYFFVGRYFRDQINEDTIQTAIRD